MHLHFFVQIISLETLLWERERAQKEVARDKNSIVLAQKQT
jgi:hypothetical protein